ncbi:glycosyltransferase family 2 protein [Ensifer sp. MJa1]|uniref:glycosyltransferase family 2 protein n=1 Tax=Ensifer sp. MJa1 TaxID=2919888 RepID=UPI00300853B4
MVADRTLYDRLVTWYTSAKVQRRERRKHFATELRCISANGQTALRPDDLPLLFLTHNDAKLVPSLLAHYRKLGVTRFICVDDVSTDGTREYLLAEPDVDLWASSIRFKDARRGRAWREALFGLYGYGRWYVNIDSDEFLVYDDYENRPLRSLIDALEENNIRRLPAPMLDMYPVDIDAADVDQLKTRAPHEIADHFDASGYTLSTTKRAISVKGGPRQREFSYDLEMIKYPLIFWDKTCRFGASIHQPLPYQRNFPPVLGVLLHFKFFADYEKVFQDAVADGQYFDGSAAYAKMNDVLAETGALKLFSSSSVKFEGSRQLLELGFITPVPAASRG